MIGDEESKGMKRMKLGLLERRGVTRSEGTRENKGALPGRGGLANGSLCPAFNGWPGHAQLPEAVPV